MGVKLRERPGKGWYVLIDWKGQRKARCFGKNKKRAQQFADKMDARLKWADQTGENLGLNAPEKKMPTIREYLTDWQETHAKVHCKPSTYRGYTRAINSVLMPRFGDFLLSDLNREHIRHLVADLIKKGKARGTIENHLVPLKAIFYQAMDDGWVQVNPVARLAKLFSSQKDHKATITPLDREEVAHLLKTTKELFPNLYPIVLCAARTGLRQGELVGLQFSDIDFHGEFIEVRRGVVLRQETTTKTHKIRRVDMSQQLHDTLRKLKEVRELEAMANGQELIPWVFLSPSGKRWDDRHLRRAWSRCLNASGLRQIRFHDLRHTYASELAEQGAPPKYVQSQLGHSSIQMTMDVYSHFFEKRNREWVNRLDDSTEISREARESATQAQPEPKGSECRTHKLLKKLVAVEGFEPPARGL